MEDKCAQRVSLDDDSQGADPDPVTSPATVLESAVLAGVAPAPHSVDTWEVPAEFTSVPKATQPEVLCRIEEIARVAKLADARDLKSRGPKGPCRFKSGPGHQILDPSTSLRLAQDFG